MTSKAEIPQHLQRYIVEQNYDRYTPIDHAVWRFVLRQLKSFLSRHAHESYMDGLQKTGIEIEYIPRISDISAKLEKFGWRALPVSGFIPPAAFMELQSLGILPIASDMRSAEHLTYTPAPDIVHEAAGHAPMLAHPEFADYLKHYADVAKKAIISSEDLSVYEAIRTLSDLKENPDSTIEDIFKAETHLQEVTHGVSHDSEAAKLSRMNWWTAEYGLIGDLESPKIFGAGLLSSVGESQWCLSQKVKKIPLSLECIEMSYDITEPQPQLFVAKDFHHLHKVLDELAEQMAFKTGGFSGLQKALLAKTVNTVQLETGLQISGVLTEVTTTDAKSKDVIYLQMTGPTQLCFESQEIPGQGCKAHQQGFGFPLGDLDASSLNTIKWNKENQGSKVWHLEKCEPTSVLLKTKSGIEIQGKVFSRYVGPKGAFLISFKEATVRKDDKIFFDPSWGTYDMALGTEVISVFGGPADRIAYGETSDFIAARVPVTQYSEEQKKKHQLFVKTRELRKHVQLSSQSISSDLENIYTEWKENYASEWLLALEIYELSLKTPESSLQKSLYHYLQEEAQKNTPLRPFLLEGIELASQI